jgi:hypothetical protein
VRNYSLFIRCWFLLHSRPWLHLGLCLCRALLFSIYLQPLSLLFPTLQSSALPGEGTAASEQRKALRPRLALALRAEQCWAQAPRIKIKHIAGRRHSPPAAPASHGSGTPRAYEKFNNRGRCGFTGFRGSARDAMRPFLRPPPSGGGQFAICGPGPAGCRANALRIANAECLECLMPLQKSRKPKAANKSPAAPDGS